jgi:hypothetical protein
MSRLHVPFIREAAATKSAGRFAAGRQEPRRNSVTDERNPESSFLLTTKMWPMSFSTVPVSVPRPAPGLAGDAGPAGAMGSREPR